MAEYIEIPEGGIGEVSDGYHTFNALYHQRLILTAALVKAHKDVAWKSWRHEDGQLCFGGGWFIVGFDTPDGGYTYHYEAQDWDLFDCVELPCGKHWDGHTDADVGRLLSISAADAAPVRHGRWITTDAFPHHVFCSECHKTYIPNDRWQVWQDQYGDGGLPRAYCPNCGAKMGGEE